MITSKVQSSPQSVSVNDLHPNKQHFAMQNIQCMDAHDPSPILVAYVQLSMPSILTMIIYVYMQLLGPSLAASPALLC